MKFRLLLSFLILTQTLLAQPFTEAPQSPPFDGVQLSSIAFADVDGDNDQDVLITGLNSSLDNIAKLYTNDGTGAFTEATGIPFEGVQNGSVAFADVDGDGDMDVLITGNILLDGIAKLYRNDGSGAFAEVPDTPFEGVQNGSAAFADVDGDGDEDVLITGLNNDSDLISKLYINDGEGAFTEATDTPFEGVRS
jgi:predicted nucleotidyltransferase